MIFELADIEVLPGHEAEFEAGVRTALPLFARATGCHGAALHRVIEKERHYVLQVGWETVDDHMVHFRESADFQTWRALVGPHFARAPQVVHATVVIE
ncbi:antibiotic biosynthesis monooxygenase [Burkholderia sp. Ax-1719]|uniref:antibiotic biosynthesis monooxygenase family protein n=1 Tax=Burkholderia sp. Ax-1719 TaxID=2608334 RepID=UPI0014237EDD|nr:antibiotic biosynthesis monooxygenase [Burkholderia sp. Ax-1719]NIE62678.1 antibiotic biosynthesis monooxygenase [Burkholderia sp. Ax-1719]